MAKYAWQMAPMKIAKAVPMAAPITPNLKTKMNI